MPPRPRAGLTLVELRVQACHQSNGRFPSASLFVTPCPISTSAPAMPRASSAASRAARSTPASPAPPARAARPISGARGGPIRDASTRTRPPPTRALSGQKPRRPIGDRNAEARADTCRLPGAPSWQAAATCPPPKGPGLAASTAWRSPPPARNARIHPQSGRTGLNCPVFRRLALCRYGLLERPAIQAG